MPDSCDIASGAWADLNGNNIPDECEPCATGDITCDGFVNVSDLLQVVASWGECPAGLACPADISPAPDGDGFVNVSDLLMVVANWR